MSLSKFLKTARQKKGLSQKDVAIQLDYTSAQYISNWERGIATPPPKNFKLIAKVYSLDLKKLIQLYINEIKLRVKKEVGII